MIERFKNEKIAVIVNTEQEYKNLMKLLEKHNLKWGTGSKATGLNYWNVYKKQTCISYDLENFSTGISFCRAEFFKNNGYKIINYNKFIKGVEMETKFTKKDLKVGDIITLRNGKKGKWNGEEFQVRNSCWLKEYNIENDLTNNGCCGSELDIVKVERQSKTKIVYERKKEILDEAEKRYLSDVIRPFRNKVIYIRKVSFEHREFIKIVFKNEVVPFPYFKKDSMYKGMEPNKKYSLEELGL